jgi:predicted nucleic acid-binding Zn ribbon protein
VRMRKFGWYTDTSDQTFSEWLFGVGILVVLAALIGALPIIGIPLALFLCWKYGNFRKSERVMPERMCPEHYELFIEEQKRRRRTRRMVLLAVAAFIVLPMLWHVATWFLPR